MSDRLSIDLGKITRFLPSDLKDTKSKRSLFSPAGSTSTKMGPKKSLARQSIIAPGELLRQKL